MSPPTTFNMHRASQKEEIYNLVSKKLATSQLPRRRSQTTTNPYHSVVPRPSRVGKPSSRHGSPKLHERRSTNTAPKYMPAAESTVIHGTGVTPMSRPTVGHVHRPERPYSWHPTSHSSQDATFIPYSNQLVALPHGNADVWQLSSYEWPGETQHVNQRSFYDLGGLILSMDQVDQFSAPKTLPVENEFNFGGHPAYYTQHTEHGDGHMYPAGPLMINQDTMQSSTMFPTARASVHEQRHPAEYNTVNFPQNDFQMAPPPFLREPDSLLHQGKATQEEELVGLGLYDREEDVSPLQLCSGLSTSAPTQFGGQPSGRGLKLEETWQPPPEWQPCESTEGSEASASPYEEAQRYSSYDHEHVPFLQIPQQYPPEFGPTNFLFEVEDDWFTGGAKPTPAPHMGFAGYDWCANDTGNIPY